MKAIKIKENELSQVRKGEVINFKKIKENYTTIFGETALVIEFNDGTETSIIESDYRIIND